MKLAAMRPKRIHSSDCASFSLPPPRPNSMRPSFHVHRFTNSRRE